MTTSPRTKKLIAGLIITGILIVGFLQIKDPLGIYLAERSPSSKLFLGKIIAVQEETNHDRALTVQLLTGPEKNTTTTITARNLDNISGPYAQLKIGERVVVSATDFSDQPYYIVDRYRVPALLGVTLIFIAATIIFGRKRGLTSLLGLVASILVFGLFMIPQILHGKNPVGIGLASASMIAVISLYLAHGFNKRTSIALASTLITLGISVLLSLFFVWGTHLIGFATEESFYLALQNTTLDLRGLLLAGIIIGALGVLDDITVSQTAIVHELHDVDPSLAFRQLYERGLSIGREHIASLVNTLFLAYAGASLPLLLYLTAYHTESPFWLVLNTEALAEEIVRTLVGSISLILAVPIATFFAAWFLSRNTKSAKAVS